MLGKRAIILLISIFVIICVVPLSSDAGKYNVKENDHNIFFIEGVADDLIEIELLTSSASISLTIMEYEDYIDWLFNDPYNVDWQRESMTSGKWDWKMPTDETWILLVSNEHDFSINYEIEVTNKNAKEEMDTLLDEIITLQVENSKLEEDKSELETQNAQLLTEKTDLESDLETEKNSKTKLIIGFLIAVPITLLLCLLSLYLLGEMNLINFDLRVTESKNKSKDKKKTLKEKKGKTVKVIPRNK